MFNRVIIFVTAILAVSAQNHYSHEYATSSESIIRYDASHNDHGYGLPYHATPAVIHSNANSYYHPTIHVAPITHNALTHAVPIAHVAPITHIAPITHHTTNAGAIAHAMPVYNAPIVHAAPIAHNIPIYTHHAPVHHVAPIIHHAAPHYAPVYHNQYRQASEHQDYHAYPQYEFQYSVHDSHTGDIKSQHEARDGDVVNGAYSLHKADGSVRTVNYNTHGRSGFNAEVHHSQPSTHVQPAPHYYHH